MTTLAAQRPRADVTLERAGWLDLVRVLAIAAVVAIHVMAPVGPGSPGRCCCGACSG